MLQSKIKFCIKSGVNSSGVIIAPIPKIKNKLSTQEPTKLPTAISVSLRIAAKIDVTSSGRAVPIATTVKPITLSDILKYKAMFVAESTTKSPPYFNKNTPTTINNRENGILILKEGDILWGLQILLITIAMK